MSESRKGLRQLDLRLSVDERHAVDRYREAFADIFDANVDRTLIHCGIEKVDLGGAVLGRERMVGQTFKRMRSHIRRNGIDHIQVVYSVDGNWCGDCDGQSSAGGAGSVRIIDTARANHSSTSHELISLTIPRAALGPDHVNRNVHGLVLTEDAPIVKLLTAHMRTLWRTVQDLTPMEAHAGALAAGVMLGAAIASQARLEADQRKPVETTLIAMAREYINGNLLNSALSPSMISLHLGISKRSLFRLFEPVGGVANFIQARRLERAHQAIVRSSGAGMSLAEIAYAHAFKSDAHFSRAFKARFGVPPGEVRQGGT